MSAAQAFDQLYPIISLSLQLVFWLSLMVVVTIAPIGAAIWFAIRVFGWERGVLFLALAVLGGIRLHAIVY